MVKEFILSLPLTDRGNGPQQAETLPRVRKDVIKQKSRKNDLKGLQFDKNQEIESAHWRVF